MVDMSWLDDVNSQLDYIKPTGNYKPVKDFNEFSEMFGMPEAHSQYVYHGTPVDNLKQFDINRAGSINGSEYGKGIYTGDYHTATTYADDIFGNTMEGHVYKVQIPRDEYLYNADKPFRRQSKYVRDKIINWNEIPKQNKQQWIDMLLGRANPLEEGLDVINSVGFSDDSYSKPGGLLEKMGIHGKIVKPELADSLYRVIFNPKYAKIVDKMFGLMDPFTMGDMLKLQGMDPRLIVGSQKEKQEALDEYGYTIDYDKDGNPILKSRIVY